MTTADFTERDLDRLADYTVDALDPADAAEVALLIETNPTWAVAHRSLLAADTKIKTELHGYPHSRLETMPVDVANRLDEAIAAAAGTRNVVSLEAHRRRRANWPAIAGVAAAVAAVFFGLSAIDLFPTTANDSGSPVTSARDNGFESQGDGAGPGGGLPASGPATAPRLTASGQNYTAESLSAAKMLNAAPPVEQPATAPTGKAVPEIDGMLPDSAPSELQRLADPAALAQCLNLIRQAHAGQVRVVDFARFEGQPALVVIVAPTAGLGPATAVAVGPDCGLGDVDERAARLTTP